MYRSISYFIKYYKILSVINKYNKYNELNINNKIFSLFVKLTKRISF